MAREKQIKSWRRSKKVDLTLIESLNPRCKDLSLEWCDKCEEALTVCHIYPTTSRDPRARLAKSVSPAAV